MHPFPFHPSPLHFQGCPSSPPHRSPQACPRSLCLSPPHTGLCLHQPTPSAFTNPLPSRSGSPFPPTVKLPGLHIWRVEKLKPVPVAPENYGIFFSGDSYLVLHNGPEELSHLHLWIGKGGSWEVWWWGCWPGQGSDLA